MKKIALIFAAASAMTAASTTIATRAEAQQYPYCLASASGRGSFVERCEYTTMAQCQASAQGVAGSCTYNWRLAYAQPVEPPLKGRYRQRAY